MLDADEYEKLRNRMSQFQKETNVKSAIHITLICGNGYKKGKYSGIVQNVILGDDLFEKQQSGEDDEVKNSEKIV